MRTRKSEPTQIAFENETYTNKTANKKNDAKREKRSLSQSADDDDHNE